MVTFDSVSDILSDPLVRLVMASDGISDADLLAAWDCARGAVRSPRGMGAPEHHPGGFRCTSGDLAIEEIVVV
jgi:hypothetical protein